MKKISAIIACYKDGEAIPEMHERLTKVLKNTSYDYEIIFVNDGSPDNSELILNKICNEDKKVTGIFHSRNFGTDNAFSSGMVQSTGDAVVLLDGDLQDPPELIPDFISNCGMARVFAYFMERKVQMTDEAIFNDTSMTIKNAIQNTFDNNSNKINISKTAFEIALKQLI